MKFDVSKFFSEVRLELSKVEWPTYKEFMAASIVVLLVVIASVIFLGIVDKVIAMFIRYVFEYVS